MQPNIFSKMNYVKCVTVFGLVISCLTSIKTEEFIAVERPRCENRYTTHIHPHSIFRERLGALRTEMQIRASVQGSEIDGYIVPSFDEHQNSYVANFDRRLQYITGFQGNVGIAVVTLKKSAIWLEQKHFFQADTELDCEWRVFEIRQTPSIPAYLSQVLPPNSKIGADPKLIPHYLWMEWENELSKYGLRLIKINRNLIDGIWGRNRPPKPMKKIKVYKRIHAGESWLSKVETLRNILNEQKCDAIVISSLTEIAYMLNIRGGDIPYVPVIKAYMVVTKHDIILYTDKTKLTDDVHFHLNSATCFSDNCVKIRDYDKLWSDLLTNTQIWSRVFLPSQCVFDQGISEAIHSIIPHNKTYEGVSPVVFMKAQKNIAEREGMRNAGIRDGAAMCDFLSYFERDIQIGESYTESKVALELDRTRYSQSFSEGLSLETIIGFGAHGAFPYYINSNITDVNITKDSTIVIDSGGQYIDGTTRVSRTIHLGEPTDEQRKAYTAVLSGIIRLSTLVFPDNLKPSEVDALARGPVWESHSDYPHGTGHGVGAFSSVHESPISVSYTEHQKYTFQDGYFFSSEPAFYKNGSFGVRLGNVLEVVDSGKRHPTGAKFLAFRDVTFVPFEPKLIDRTLLSTSEKKWLNEYNANIRDLVGNELKKQLKMNAFYWVMNKTHHIIEYLPKHDYQKNSSKINSLNMIVIIVGILLCRLNY